MRIKDADRCRIRSRFPRAYCRYHPEGKSCRAAARIASIFFAAPALDSRRRASSRAWRIHSATDTRGRRSHSFAVAFVAPQVYAVLDVGRGRCCIEKAKHRWDQANLVYAGRADCARCHICWPESRTNIDVGARADAIAQP